MIRHEYGDRVETSDEEILDRTGRRWGEWCDLLDGWAGEKCSFAAIAAYLIEQHQVRRLWAQAIAFYYRRRELR